MSLEQQVKSDEKIVLPHHKQQQLCTTRLPYRQGRKLTAVKTYSITTESPHLLIFNVPSLNLRHETKALFAKFGRLAQFHISRDHVADTFTETYHALYDNIQSARYAKRMVDTKNFYGAILHVCYAPELESIEETRQKLFKRQTDVLNRLKNLQREDLRDKERVLEEKEKIIEERKENKKVDMSVENVIFGKGFQVIDSDQKKRKSAIDSVSKRFKPVFIENEIDSSSEIDSDNLGVNSHKSDSGKTSKNNNIFELKDGKKTAGHGSYSESNTPPNRPKIHNIEIIDCTSTEKEIISNINEALNYNKFGNEVIRKVPEKPVNKIQFNVINKNKLV